MAKTDALLDRLHLPRQVLGVSSDVFGVVAGSILVGPTIVGLVAGQLAPALVAALMACLLVIVYLLSRLRSSRAQIVRFRRHNAAIRVRLGAAVTALEILEANFARQMEFADGFRRKLERVAAGESDEPTDDPSPEPTLPSAWLSDPSDLTSFTMTVADFESLYDAATRTAIAELGADARVRLDHVVLLSNHMGTLQNIPRVAFWATSAIALRRTLIEYHGNIDRTIHTTVPWAPVTKASGGRTGTSKPWHTDPDFKELVVQSWRRQRGFHGFVQLDALIEPLEGTTSRWVITYISLAPHDAGVMHNFTLESGQIEEVPLR